MGIYSAQFKDLTFKQVQGFKISTAFSPRSGFEGRFLVYLWDCIEADTAFEKPVKVVDGTGDRIRDSLVLKTKDDKVRYTFPKITLGHAEIGATRAHRYRLVEFDYPRDLTERGESVDIDLQNSSEDKLEYGRLKKDYNFNLEGGSEEPLLGYRTRLLPNGVTVIRYAAIRNKENSFLKKLIEINKAQLTGEMPKFKISFKQGPVEVTQDNLVVAFVDESWGFFTDLPLPALGRVAEMARDANRSLAQLTSEDFSPERLMKHTDQNFAWDYATANAVETATFVFQSGKYPELNVT